VLPGFAQLRYFDFSKNGWALPKLRSVVHEEDAMPWSKKKREVVVITGASAGAGRATARAFARRGAAIGLVARGKEGLEAAREEVESLGGKAIAIPADVADADAVENAAATVEAKLGPIDVWVNNAMVSVFSPAREMTAAEYKRVTEVTYLGYVYGTLAALRCMLPRDRGTIVQVGSALAYRGIPLIAGPSMQFRGLRNRCDASCCTMRATCGSRWCRCRR
jgi:NADP-dependent 3-hydroxy acid dehydrogenase YdfG